jgi:hypothetical protein
MICASKTDNQSGKPIKVHGFLNKKGMQVEFEKSSIVLCTFEDSGLAWPVEKERFSEDVRVGDIFIWETEKSSWILKKKN